MRAIFISYRRDDTEGHAGRLFEDLCDRFGKALVFMDVSGIEPGRDFRRVIDQQVASCGVLLAVIGKNWLTAADEQGKRRLDDPYDFVRLETASALKRDIPVVPVLVHQAGMPRVEQLPDDLKDLAFRNAVELTHARWNSDVQLLITALLPYVGEVAPAPPPPPPPSPRTLARWGVPVAVLVAAGAGYVGWDRLRPNPAALAGGASGAAGAASVVSVAAGPAPMQAPAPAPAPAPLAPPATTSAPTAMAPASVPSPAAAASKPPAVRHVDKPLVARAPPPPPELVRVPSPAPIVAVAPVSPAPAPAPAYAPPAAPPLASPQVLEARRDPSLELLGSPGSASTATRTISIGAGTTHVNVTGGEIIRFDVSGKSFVWNFNGQRTSFDLARVAPPSVLDHSVTAYVAANPMYIRR